MRVNPDVDAATHPYISTGLREHKFGIDIARSGSGLRARARRSTNLLLEGVSCHIGSQMLDTAPMLEAFDKCWRWSSGCARAGFAIRHARSGRRPGRGLQAGDEAPDIRELHRRPCATHVGGTSLQVMIEPGRSIVAEAGVLLTRVLYRKTNGDKGIRDRGCRHERSDPAGALSVASRDHSAAPKPTAGTITADVVGPVCETGDFLARDREMANVHARAICWRSAPPALTVSWRPPTTTRGPARRRCWWKAESGA